MNSTDKYQNCVKFYKSIETPQGQLTFDICLTFASKNHSGKYYSLFTVCSVSLKSW